MKCIIEFINWRNRKYDTCLKMMRLMLTIYLMSRVSGMWVMKRVDVEYAIWWRVKLFQQDRPLLWWTDYRSIVVCRVLGEYESNWQMTDVSKSLKLMESLALRQLLRTGNSNFVKTCRVVWWCRKEINRQLNNSTVTEDQRTEVVCQQSVSI